MKTLLVGASENPSRYSYRAIGQLRAHGHEVVALGLKPGSVAGVNFQVGQPPLEDIDTVTLYLNAANQQPLYDYLLSLHPRRIIFNPGAENAALEELAHAAGIATEEACTLVLLSTGQFEKQVGKF